MGVSKRYYELDKIDVICKQTTFIDTSLIIRFPILVVKASPYGAEDRRFEPRLGFFFIWPVSDPPASYRITHNYASSLLVELFVLKTIWEDIIIIIIHVIGLFPRCRLVI